MRSPIVLFIGCLMLASAVHGQSATTESLRKKHSDAFELFFYNNTLRMLNQSESVEFDELIKDIEKMRFLMIRKQDSTFGTSEYRRLVDNYKSEAFEEIMTSRHDGKTFEVYLKENNGRTKGMLVLINDATNLYILDILGSIALNKVTTLFNMLDRSTDIGNKIREFVRERDR